MNRETALQLAQTYKQTLKEAGIPVTSVIVFGSVARNAMHEHSDIDIAVIGRSFKDDQMEEMHELWKLRRPISYKLQPLWFYPEHMENKFSSLAAEIKNDGIEI